jgi:hypothetical protein
MLRDLGYVEGKNIAFEYRFADNKVDRLPALADELVRLKVDVLVIPGINEALAAKNATRTIPIVFMTSADPAVAGLVDSLARPGGEHHWGSPTLETCWLASDWNYLRKPFPALPSCGSVGSTGGSKLRATMERKPTAGTRTGSAASFHGSQQRRQIRERLQRSD